MRNQRQRLGREAIAWLAAARVAVRVNADLGEAFAFGNQAAQRSDLRAGADQEAAVLKRFVIGFVEDRQGGIHIAVFSSDKLGLGLGCVKLFFRCCRQTPSGSALRIPNRSGSSPG